jgi:hypothetical protein
LLVVEIPIEIITELSLSAKKEFVCKERVIEQGHY